ncbi:MAG: hypothetical protein KJ558_13590 [Gammaproteobacteria bacterium]|nr:hypothetical protein [Gammaproteobacteria bacterium]MBU1655827.1 hypothetical protein [Gammaproteobacteria bacterium]MBU1961727.1 hypothetical protein [Gammaproteobacteria bacterium]
MSGKHRGLEGISTLALAGLLAMLAAGCDSTIHRQANIGGVDTLSLDAKQRLKLVGNRSGHEGIRVTCTEPSPDALVAKAAVMAASGKVPNGADGGVSGGSSESAASIGFRDHTVQMLRDGYFRLCEAYMNGAVDKAQYAEMVRNIDTFMVVVSALQIVGTNPVAPAVAISAGSMTAKAGSGGPEAALGDGTKASNIEIKGVQSVENKNADAAVKIVQAYLNYRRQYRLRV